MYRLFLEYLQELVMDREACQAIVHGGCKESDKTEWLNLTDKTFPWSVKIIIKKWVGKTEAPLSILECCYLVPAYSVPCMIGQ